MTDSDPAPMDTDLSASRQAKRFLDDHIRTDWEFPLPPDALSPNESEVHDATGFRERYYGDSDSGESVLDAGPYKFDSPDGVGEVVQKTAQERKDKRRERLWKEMESNEGLRIWIERRDVWTGVASVRKHGTKRKRSAVDTKNAISLQSVITAVNGAAMQSVNGAREAKAKKDANVLASPTSITSLLTSSSVVQLPHGADFTTSSWTPIAPPLLPTNPIRTSITPKSYPDIFQKIVLSSRTPSVPINLADMTAALVQGWKDTDEWPPKIGVLDPLPGLRRRKGDEANKKDGRRRSLVELMGMSGAGAGGDGFMERHGWEKKVGSVKRMLHMGGVGGANHE